MSTRIQIIILAALILVFALMIFHINKKNWILNSAFRGCFLYWYV